MVGLLVFGTNMKLIILFVLNLLNRFSLTKFGLLFIIKFNVEFHQLYKTAVFLNQKEVLRSYFLSSIVHPFYTLFVAIFSLKKSNSGKGRDSKK